MLATVKLDFDPTLAVFGAALRLETLALAGVVLLVLLIAAVRAGRTPAPGGKGHLRRDDLLFVALGSIPGAVVGGRLDYALIHLDYYRANSDALLDPSQGSLALTLAVVLGTVAGLAVARLLAAPLGRWLHVAAVPLLVGLGLGKLAMVLGGAGQGQFGAGTLSTWYARPAIWESAFADLPAVASQAIEGVLVLAAAVAILLVPFLLRFRVRRWWRLARPGWAPRREWSLLTGGRRFGVALLLWAAIRFAVAFGWRDPPVLGALRAEQLLLAALMALLVLGLLALEIRDLARARAGRRAGLTARSGEAPGSV